MAIEIGICRRDEIQQADDIYPSRSRSRSGHNTRVHRERKVRAPSARVVLRTASRYMPSACFSISRQFAIRRRVEIGTYIQKGQIIVRIFSGLTVRKKAYFKIRIVAGKELSAEFFRKPFCEKVLADAATSEWNLEK